MGVTYESICEKLGCRPCDIVIHFSGTEDDSKPSPFSVLTKEESDFLFAYYMKNGSFEPEKS